MSHNGGTFGFSSDAIFFPEHGVGLVVLTNAAGAGGYVGAVRRKLVELLFDANEEAEKQLAFGINQLDEVMKKRSSEITMQPDDAFVEPLVGAWTTSGLGEIRIVRDGNRYIFDAGEWKSTLGEHTDRSGARRIILTSPPLAGLTFWPQNNEGRPALLLETGQQKYWFERAGSR